MEILCLAEAAVPRLERFLFARAAFAWPVGAGIGRGTFTGGSSMFT